MPNEAIEITSSDLLGRSGGCLSIRGIALHQWDHLRCWCWIELAAAYNAVDGVQGTMQLNFPTIETAALGNFTSLFGGLGFQSSTSAASPPDSRGDVGSCSDGPSPGAFCKR
jgi:hypothetical protein